MKDKFEERLKQKYEQLKAREAEQEEGSGTSSSSSNLLKRKNSALSQLPEKSGGFKRSSAHEAKLKERLKTGPGEENPSARPTGAGAGGDSSAMADDRAFDSHQDDNGQVDFLPLFPCAKSTLFLTLSIPSNCQNPKEASPEPQEGSRTGHEGKEQEKQEPQPPSELEEGEA